MAAKIRKELGQDVEMVAGHYGEFKVLVDGKVTVEAGAWGILGVLPSSRQVIQSVRKSLAL